MADIKSARDIALERISNIGQATEVEKLKWKYTPEGEKIAVAYLKNDTDLSSDIGRHPDIARNYIKAGIESVLLTAIILPKNEIIQAKNKKAMDGIPVLKKDKAAANKILGQIKQIFSHYSDQGENQRKQAYETLKEQYKLKLKKAVDKQLGISAGADDLSISVESLPQFQDEWRRISAQMDDQYLRLLDGFKAELRRIT
jgi:hypothetical protein